MMQSSRGYLCLTLVLKLKIRGEIMSQRCFGVRLSLACPGGQGKSDGEVMRFCQAFMTELQRHIGAYTFICVPYTHRLLVLRLHSWDRLSFQFLVGTCSSKR